MNVNKHALFNMHRNVSGFGQNFQKLGKFPEDGYLCNDAVKRKEKPSQMVDDNSSVFKFPNLYYYWWRRWVNKIGISNLSIGKPGKSKSNSCNPIYIGMMIVDQDRHSTVVLVTYSLINSFAWTVVGNSTPCRQYRLSHPQIESS